MKQAHYPLRGLIADYARSLAGIVCLGFPMSYADLPTYLAVFFWAIISIFLVYGGRTVNRHLTVFDYDDTSIRARGGIPGAIDWKDLELVNLRYFSTRRDRHSGWLHLQLAGSGKKLRLDSSLNGFQEIATLAYHKAIANRLELQPHSLANFASMGLGDDPLADNGGDDKKANGQEMAGR